MLQAAPPEETKCEGVVSDEKSRKKIIPTSSPDPPHVLLVKTMM